MAFSCTLLACDQRDFGGIELKLSPHRCVGTIANKHGKYFIHLQEYRRENAISKIAYIYMKVDQIVTKNFES